MTVIVKGHGSRPDDQTTFVPVGTKLRFYSDFDVDLASNVALVAIATGAGGTAQETIEGTGEETDVANYRFATQDDGFIARWLAIGGENGIPIYWVGSSDIKHHDRLCNSPDVCDGTHSCKGVLGLLKDEKDIVILACRGYLKDKDPPVQSKYGKDASDPLHALDLDVDAFAEKMLALAKTDPAAAEKEADGLPQGSIAMLTNHVDFDNWLKARYVKDQAQAGDFEQMIGHLKANQRDLEGIMEALADFPTYGEAVDQAVVANMKTFLEEFTAAPSNAVLAALATRPAIDVAVKALRSGWQPKDTDLAAITQRNDANLKNLPDDGTGAVLAGGLLVLIGDGHDPRAAGYVRRQGDFEQGKFKLTKGGAFSVGSLNVTGISGKQTLVEQAVEAISKKKVKFG